MHLFYSSSSSASFNFKTIAYCLLTLIQIEEYHLLNCFLAYLAE